ncbi:pyridoxine 5'-phosphate synthase [Acetobacter orleanensis]|uniref:Pyridoxine 5'-phosphate synthase n=1 Tax=Acetobacter orleanensis TaxID=104099 RepID=A0A4Y3TS51_9PROT|nr:pyridoxine 5'-phosphate synthase [Acetobacter orleanensis]KXV66743.1 pyridoxine 5'-phosphate synthase [Acetobacter orleanensis]PCD78775.1 pyridoxine 5'-phosphate synthase [Acetobacter orleanensis]GAN69538.1 pyridoxine 5'-phosphate synthase [Acetobacter orleanensis JCM 7639]GBR23457.1 pyridoxine 5'-phosphate synthase [Acetobacter orleanensis NRIC 0473]GEB83907.1 pyridoxine 5'-phosphate synthase [Acetobacter orleanensis]
MTASPRPPIRLGVNIDHVATVRNARGGVHPDPVAAALLAIQSGADGITAHLREDRRHIRDSDLKRLRAEVEAPLNMEMAATDEMVALACELLPHACCIVPERREELTTEGGLDVAGQLAALKPRVQAVVEKGIRVSLFIDPDPAQIEAAVVAGAQVVELHTGAYAEGRVGELERLRAAATYAAAAGLEVHAGHGLTYDNVASVAALPEIMELNIGHFLIGQAIFDGLPTVIDTMKRRIQTASAR